MRTLADALAEVAGKPMPADRKLPEDCPKTARKLPENCPKTARELSENCLKTAAG
jgi:hypothetical protein